MYKFNAIDLIETSDTIGFVQTLALFSQPLNIRISMPANLWDRNIGELNLSVRASNALMRQRIDTIGKLSEQIMSPMGINGVKNLGVKSISEIKTTLLAYCYEELNDREKMAFWTYVIDNNGGAGNE